MKLDSKSSVTTVCDRILEANLYRLGRLSRERSRRLRSMVLCLSFGRKTGSWSDYEWTDMIIYRRGKGRWIEVCGYSCWGLVWVCVLLCRYLPGWVWVSCWAAWFLANALVARLLILYNDVTLYRYSNNIFHQWSIPIQDHQVIPNDYMASCSKSSSKSSLIASRKCK